MKKALSLISLILVGVVVFSSTAFAATPRWANVLAITPHISQVDGLYASTITGFSGTTKIDCTLVLYEKGLFGFHEVDRTNDVYNGQVHRFEGYYDIKSGKTYKLTTTVTVVRNGVSETAEHSFEKSF